MDMDRLSIDIDIHYTGAGGIDEYPQFVAVMRDVFAREGLLVNRKSLSNQPGTYSFAVRDICAWRTNWPAAIW